jgi:hypothetical protein
MAVDQPPRAPSMILKQPPELSPGDVVELACGPAEVTAAPFLGRGGASVFDSFDLFWRARVRPLNGDSRPAYATWGLGDRIPVRVRRVGCADDGHR